MRGIATTGTSVRSRLWLAVSSVLPESWLRWLNGPATTIVIGANETRTLVRRGWWRPVHVFLESELVLRSRLSLPASARGDLASSVELMVLSTTPFTPSELLVHVSELDRRDGSADIAYSVHLTPRDRIAEALAVLGLAAWRVAKIVPQAPLEPAVPDFAPALGLASNLRRYGVVLSIGIVVVALLALGQTHLARLRSENAVLDGAVVEREVAIRSTLSELTKQQDAIRAQALVDQTFRGTPSSFLLLEQLRANLPPAVTVTRMSLDGSVLRLDVRAPEMLQLLRALAAAMPEWKASVEGSIARAPDGVTELATLLLQWTAQ